MANPFLDRQAKNEGKAKAHVRSPVQEKQIAKRFGGVNVGGKTRRTDALGGARDRPHKGDVHIKGIARIEAKTTSNDSFRVTKEIIDKITGAAVPYDEVAAIIIEMLGPLGKPEKEMAIISVSDLERLIKGQK